MSKWKKPKKVNWQNQMVLLVLPILAVPIFAQSPVKKMGQMESKDVIAFALFNYDNLIADYYEKTDTYRQQLGHLLHKNTGCSEDTIKCVLDHASLAKEANPVQYLMVLNKRTKEVCGYYFLDD
ncbi:MAG: hypothetical protein Q7T50_08395 [Candidatus Magasanikbacteria bacterium]|nr:hypothetical protein [Candidatus Magasanikbacteria bacterium]